MAAEDAGDGGGGWSRVTERARQDGVELAPAPGRVGVAQREHLGFDVGVGAGRARVGPPRAVGERVVPAVTVACAPLRPAVAGG